MSQTAKFRVWCLPNFCDIAAQTLNKGRLRFVLPTSMNRPLAMLASHIAKGLMVFLTISVSGSRSEKDQTTSRKDQMINDKDKRIFRFLLFLGVNGP